jgi:hypothetical protein
LFESENNNRKKSIRCQKEHFNPRTERERISTDLEKECLLSQEEKCLMQEEEKVERSFLFLASLDQRDKILYDIKKASTFVEAFFYAVTFNMICLN